MRVHMTIKYSGIVGFSCFGGGALVQSVNEGALMTKLPHLFHRQLNALTTCILTKTLLCSHSNCSDKLTVTAISLTKFRVINYLHLF